MLEASYFVIGTLSMVVMMLAIIIFVYRFQIKLASRNKAYQEIEELMKAQELKSAYVLLEGQEFERKRIAAELHDNIGGLAATLKIYADLNASSEKPDDILRLNLKISELAEGLTLEVRKLSHELDLRTLSGFGLHVAIQQLCEGINASQKLNITCYLNISEHVSEQDSLNLYRVIQELLTNTLKHAGATTVRVELDVTENYITLIYEDNGKGFDPGQTREGMGIRNIRSRCNALGTRLDIDSSASGSTFIIEKTDGNED